jgi:(p)ppGpp synthase/HD superfamily hydrolase
MNETNILRAKNLATQAHAGQFRKNSGIPYITHPERVANRREVLIPLVTVASRHTKQL